MGLPVEQWMLIVLLTPLASAVAILVAGRKAGAFAGWMATGAAGVAAIGGLMLFLADKSTPEIFFATRWLEVGDFFVDLGLKFDGLTTLMVFVVTFVGFWIHVFSLGYMADDSARARYFAGLSLFMFSMLGIVLADNLLMIFIFWELVGLSSYLLIGHYLTKPSAAAASRKAFIVNRMGDFGFLLGILWCFQTFGTVNLSGLAHALPGLAETAPLAAIALLLFCGTMGKSAQVPLHVWLPDAMEGPTPVSALIHAATMVAAGVFLLCRIHFLFPPEALVVVMWVGLVTAVFAALWAFGQNDIKRVLAYSTLSQLGYMVAAFGFGDSGGHGGEHGHAVLTAGAAAAMFHLSTHAYFKALLFLGSGAVIHACHHEQDIYKMGGLAKKLPFTAITFGIGLLALAGAPYIAAGFYSKDSILAAAFAYSPSKIPFILLVVTSFLTTFYMSRLYFLVFFGKARSEEAEHAHEVGWTMRLPLIVLAGLSLVGGLYWLYPGKSLEILKAAAHPEGEVKYLIVGASFVTVLLGMTAGWLFYGKPQEDALAKRSPQAFDFLRNGFGIDRVYNYYVAKVQQRLADLVGFLDQLLIGGVMVRGTAALAWVAGLAGKRTVTGNVHGYVYWFLGGVIFFWLFAAFMPVGGN